MSTLDFARLSGAVKGRKRTDTYFVLAGLYLLNAHRAPTTAAEVRKLLKLHLGTKTPPNISAILRNNPTLFTPADYGRPLRWRLTDQGIEKLQTDSGLSLAVDSNEDSFGCDVGIICALEYPELAAVIKALGGNQCVKEIGDARHTHVYRECTLTTADGQQLRVVATTSTSMGLTAAAIATTQLVIQFRPRLVVMTGIAAGTRSGNKEFGDVLVADPSVDYASGKVVLANGI